MGGAANISLCMIVRNEAQFLPSCLQSVRGLVDEIIMVDTGSVDGSPQIARAFGAHVHRFRWNDNFADARNFSLEQATGDWILVLDADEVIAEKDRKKLLALAGGAADGYLFTYRSYSNDSRDIRWVANDQSYQEGSGWDGWIAGQVVRMFKRDRRFRFVGAVHETVDASIRRCGGKIEPTNVLIHHFHEKKGKEKLREKQLQYLRLCEKNLESMPGTAKTYFDMGLIYRHILNDIPCAVALQEQAVQLKPDYVEAQMELALLRHLTHDAPAAVKQLTAILHKNPQYAPAWFLCGILLEKSGKDKQAIECYERAIALNESLVDSRINLGTLLAKQGEFGRAREHWLKAFKMNPTNGKTLLNLGALELREGNLSVAQEFFEKALAAQPKNASAWNNLGVLHAENGNAEQARQALEQALALDPSREDVRRNLGALQAQTAPSSP
jgi:Tfp pilus assembly protein PilF